MNSRQILVQLANWRRNAGISFCLYALFALVVARAIDFASLEKQPPYSPDFNPIEHDFAALKKRREYHEQATLDHIVKAYH